MDMRNIENVTIDKAILHILDLNGAEPMLNGVAMEVTDELSEFLSNHIVRALKAEDNKKAKFTGRGVVSRTTAQMFEDADFFVKGSQDIAEHLFKAIKPISDLVSGDLIVCEFSVGPLKFIGIIKMDYVKTLQHKVAFEENAFKISVVSQEVGLPPKNQKLSACAFIQRGKEDSVYDMVTMAKKKADDGRHYFFDTFLNAGIIVDNRDKTRMFKQHVEQWIRKNLKEDFERADAFRGVVNEYLLNHALIDMDAVSQDVFGDDLDLKELFDQAMIKIGLNDGEKIEVDKRWVEKKMKTRGIKTNTGFTLRADINLFSDTDSFEIKQNGDGTVDYILKNVRYNNES